MNALVIGYGSIGQRHARILKEMGHGVAVLSSREVEFSPRFKELSAALAAHRPGYAVVANETVKHFETLQKLSAAGFKGKVLVEKPLFYGNETFDPKAFEALYVGYNLRFHPAVVRLKEILAGQRILSAQVYVGKYLPEWRPQTDYRQGYSSKKSAGGGVLRDLSHELDYVNWLFGGWTRVTAQGGHWSRLEIDSDDVFLLMITTKLCPAVTVQMNYLDRVLRREILLHTENHSVRVDLAKGMLEIDGQTEDALCERDDTYRRQHEAVLGGDTRNLCSYEDGLDVMKMIGAAEAASQRFEWVKK